MQKRVRRRRDTVVVVSRSCPPDVGGYQSQFNLILPRLAARGSDVVPIAATRASPRGRRVGWAAIPTRVVPAHVIHRRVRGVADLLVVVCAAVVGVRRRSVTPTLLLLSPTMLGGRALAWWWMRVAGRVVLRFPASSDIPRFFAGRGVGIAGNPRCTVVALSPEQLELIRGAGSDATLITNAVEHVDSRHSGADRRFLVVGRMIAQRRIELVLDAWAQAVTDLPEWSLHVVGSGGQEPDDVEPTIRERLRMRPIPRVQLHGAVPDAATMFGPGTILVHASEQEGVPNVVLEAMAAGAPVIASESAMQRWFAHPPPFVPWDGAAAESLARVLRRVVDDPRLGEIAARARRQVRDAHDPDRIADTYRMILSPPPGSCERVQVGWSRRGAAIRREATMLDLGSGAFPNPRADILCERSLRRPSRAAVVDRPFVVADAQALPFKDGAFGFVVASHLAEHVASPRALCDELSRVADSGYIETPSPWFEAVLPEANHRWVVRDADGVLSFRPKQPTARVGHYLTPILRGVYYVGSTSASDAWTPGRGWMVGRLAFALRGVLNRSGLTTTGYFFDPQRPLRARVLSG